MHLAWVGPVRPARCPQTSHSELLLPELAERATVDLFVDRYRPQSVAIRDACKVHNLQTLSILGPQQVYGAIIYQIAADPSYLRSLELLPVAPGVIDLHDLDLGPLLALPGRRVIRQLSTLLHFAQGVIVHENHQRDVIAELTSSPVCLIPLPQAAPEPLSPDEVAAVRASLGLVAGELVLVTQGSVTRPEQLREVLAAFAGMLETVPEARYIHVGEIAADVVPLWHRLRLQAGICSRTQVTGRLGDADMQKYIQCADVCIGLGEHEESIVVLRAMGAAKPVVLVASCTQGLLPAACMRIPGGEQSADALRAALLLLWAHPEMRETMGQAGLAKVRSEHAPGKIARQYVEFLVECVRWQESVSGQDGLVAAPFPQAMVAGGAPVAAVNANADREPRADDAVAAEPATAGEPPAYLPLETPVRAAAGEFFAVQLTSDDPTLIEQLLAAWSRGGELLLLATLLLPDGQVLTDAWLRQNLPVPSQAAPPYRWDVQLPAPPDPGEYCMQLTLAEELPGEPLLRFRPGWELRLQVVHDSRDPGRLAATISTRQEQLRCPPGEMVRTLWTVRNDGDTRWNRGPGTEGGFVRLGAHLRNTLGEVLVWDFARSPLPRDVYPGEEIQIALLFAAPTAPGEYRVEMDLVCELFCWFFEQGSPTVVLGLSVG